MHKNIIVVKSGNQEDPADGRQTVLMFDGICSEDRSITDRVAASIAEMAAIGLQHMQRK